MILRDELMAKLSEFSSDSKSFRFWYRISNLRVWGKDHIKIVRFRACFDFRTFIFIKIQKYTCGSGYRNTIYSRI